ncbi:MAG: hypothetical protein ACYC35_30175 [Pirellulales bacterium]
MERKRTVDWMCIVIEKVADTESHADYAFVSDVYEPDPRYRSRSMIVGQNRGRLRILKATGEITLLEAMPEDDNGKRFQRAARVIRRHWESREFPERTMFACG